MEADGLPTTSRERDLACVARSQEQHLCRALRHLNHALCR